MKAFCVSYEAPETRCNGLYVIAEKEEDILDIIAEKEGYIKESIEKLKAYEVSIEEVRISHLSAGDILRLIGAKL